MPEPHEGNEGDASTRFEAPELPDTSDLKARLDQAKKSGGAARGGNSPGGVSEEKRIEAQRADAYSLGLSLQIAYTILGVPIFGFGLGALLDFALKTMFLKGVLGLAGLIGAVIGAVVLVNRANREVR